MTRPDTSPVGGARVPELDGLRGVAIGLVVVAHAVAGEHPDPRPLVPALNWTQPGGGFVGVQLFFVLSGYLITSILVRELDNSGALRFGRFYARRARRLLPALATVVAIFLLVEALLHPARLEGSAGSALYALTYTTNLRWLIHPFADNDWLSHTWSLAVEEQFYLVWPVLLVAARRWRRWGPAVIAAAGIVSTVVIRELVGTGSEMTYEALRWDALLIGCLVALVPVRLVRGSGWVAALVIAGFALYVPQPIPGWAYTLATVASAVVLIRAFHSPWLRHPVLRYLGRVSYGLYLWHALLLRYEIPPLLSLAASFAAAEISFRCIESRFLR